MTAEGYKSPPLSDGLETRIRERLVAEREEHRKYATMGCDYRALNSDGRVSALEWVLREAESIKMETLVVRDQVRDHACDDCRHEHQGKTECGHYLGEGKFCHCESKVTA